MSYYGLSNALYTSELGLQNHQTRLDVIGNNLANVNTTGYRTERHHFGTLVEQAYAMAQNSANGRGSVNPINLGLGTYTSAVESVFRSGPIENTSRPLDCALEGNGFFLVRSGGQYQLSRAGHFYLDGLQTDGKSKLLLDNGVSVQGYNAVDGAIPATAPVEDIVIPAIGSVLPGQSTSRASFTGNLNTVPEPSGTTGATTRLVDAAGYMALGEDYAFTFDLHELNDPNATTPPSGEAVVPRPASLAFVYAGQGTAADGVTPVEQWNWSLTDKATGLLLGSATMSFYAQDDAGGAYAAGSPVSPSSFDVAAVDTTVSVDADGNPLDPPVRVRMDTFSLDLKRMTGGGETATETGPFLWSADGRDTGWLGQTVTFYETYNKQMFDVVRDENGYPVPGPDGQPRQAWQSVAVTEARSVTMQFRVNERGEEDDRDISVWDWKSSLGASDGVVDSGTMTFDANGDWLSTAPSGEPVVDYDFSSLRQLATATNVQVKEQDGFADGTLQSLSVDVDGKIFGHFSNQVSEVLAQLAVANVTNPEGLGAIGGTRFVATGASGPLSVGRANQWFTNPDGTQGYLTLSVRGGCLEGSNVQAENELTQLITTQRGYQANARTATTADEMLQTLVQLKR